MFLMLLEAFIMGALTAVVISVVVRLIGWLKESQ